MPVYKDYLLNLVAHHIFFLPIKCLYYKLHDYVVPFKKDNTFTLNNKPLLLTISQRPFLHHLNHLHIACKKSSEG